MSPGSKRHSFGRIFHRRDASDTATSDAAGVAQSPSDSSAPRVSDGGDRRQDTSRRSLGDYVRSRSRSLSAAQRRHKRDPSVEDLPAHRPQPASIKSPLRNQGPPQIPPFDHEASPSASQHVLQATGPGVPPRASSLHPPPNGRYEPDDSIKIRNTPAMPADDSYSQTVADSTAVTSKKPLRVALEDTPAPRRVADARGPLSDESDTPGTQYDPPGPLTHKPDVKNLRVSANASRDAAVQDREVRRKAAPEPQHMNPSTLDKPLPGIPRKQLKPHNDRSLDDGLRSDPGMVGDVGREPGYLVENSDQPIDTTGVVDLTNTEETHEHVTWAPAVTKEKVIVNTHEIVERVITREIHNHHVYHRVLPIMDFEVLPPRHFIPVEGGGVQEISEAEIPGGADGSARLHRLISDAVSKMIPESKAPLGPRQFTARKFEGTDCDYKEYTTPEGFTRTERWWVHPPTLETAAQASGQTQAFHFGSENPDEDGFRQSETSAVPNFSRKPLAGQASTSAKANGVVPQPHPSSTHTVLPIRMRHGERASEGVH